MKTVSCFVLGFKIPVAFGVSSYEAFNLYKGRRKIASKGDAVTNWKIHQLVLYCIVGLLAGIVGGMLGLGGGFILGPLFLEMGIPPQVKFPTFVSICRSKIRVYSQTEMLKIHLHRCRVPQPPLP